MSNRLAALFLAEGWGEAVPDDEPAEAIWMSEGKRFAAGGRAQRSVAGDVSAPSTDKTATAVAELERRLGRRTSGD